MTDLMYCEDCGRRMMYLGIEWIEGVPHRVWQCPAEPPYCGRADFVPLFEPVQLELFPERNERERE